MLLLFIRKKLSMYQGIIMWQPWVITIIILNIQIKLVYWLMSMNNIIHKERCESCRGNILTHHSVAICSICSKIVHAKCSQSYIYNQINNFWACTMCNSNTKQCYNPFEYFSDDRYAQDNSDHTDYIQSISNLLKNCTSNDIS